MNSDSRATAPVPVQTEASAAASGARLTGSASGADTLSYLDADTGVDIFADVGVGIGPGGRVGFSGFENFLGSRHDDVYTAGDAGGAFTGGRGDDDARGGAGADTLLGGNGSDTLFGGRGADSLDGGAGNDWASYYERVAWSDLVWNPNTFTYELPELAGAKVNLGIGFATDQGGSIDHLSGIRNVEGSLGSDTLYGDHHANRFIGLDGDDTIFGAGGSDTLEGGTGADLLRGDSMYVPIIRLQALHVGAADTLLGGSGGDTLYGEYGDDLLDGGSGADLLIGGPGADTLLGGTGDDTLRGRNGDDSMDGGAGDDFFTGGPGADTYVGGDGTDTVTYAKSPGGVAVALDPSLAPHLVNPGEAAGDTLRGIENVRGSKHADLLSGDAAANRLEGGGGSDALQGFGGADTLDGGSGTDTAWYTASDAGISVDLHSGWGAGGHAEGDVLRSIEKLYGSEHGDILAGRTIGSSLFGEGGDDVLIGRQGVDVLSGGSGADTLRGGRGADQLSGGRGFDFASYSAASAGVVASLASPAGNTGEAAGDRYHSVEGIEGSRHADVLGGDSLDNAIHGGRGADSLAGAEGDDTLDGGAGGDSLDGGGGRDAASYASSSNGVNASLASPAGNTGDAAGDTYVGIEDLAGSKHGDTLAGDAAANVLSGGAGDDSLSGAGGADTLRGGGGADTLDGGQGDDLLVGGAGADSFVGGEGTDTASYADAKTGVKVSLASSAGSTGDAAGDTFSGVENLTGSAFADSLSGDSGANTILGGAGADTLRGESGNDSLEGQGGFDKVYGGAGDDTLRGTGDDSLYGGNDDDLFVITAPGTQEWTYGRIDGGEGTDTVQLEHLGNDRSVIVDLATGVDDSGYGDVNPYRVLLENIENATGSSASETFHGSAGGNILRGEGGADTLNGGGGHDTLHGGEGNDRLDGGAGLDQLHGGAGADAFVIGKLADSELENDRFSRVDSTHDVILDFKQGEDRIDLSAFDLEWSDISGQSGHVTLSRIEGAEGSFFHLGLENVVHPAATPDNPWMVSVHSVYVSGTDSDGGQLHAADLTAADFVF